MARVAVNNSAHHDPRLTAAGRALRMNRERLGWRLIAVWSRVTEAKTSIMRARIVAAALGKDTELVVDALVGADLAELVDDVDDVGDDDALDLAPMRSLFGDFEWYEDLENTSQAGGKARANGAERTDEGRFQRRDVRQEIVDLLADGRPRSRGEVTQELRARKARVGREVRQLLLDDVLIEQGSRLALALDNARVPVEPTEPEPPVPTEPTEPEPSVPTEPAEPVPDSPRNPARTSAPAPAPAPAPARVSRAESVSRASDVAGSAGTGSAARSHTREPGTRNPPTGNHAERLTPERLSIMTEPVPRDERRAIARALWAYQNARRRQIEPHAPDVPLIDTPGGSLDAVVLALASYSPAQCAHALDVFAVEATCMRNAGQDALEYLNGRTNWKAEPLARAIASTPEAVRKRFKTRGNGHDPSPRRLEKLG